MESVETQQTSATQERPEAAVRDLMSTRNLVTVHPEDDLGLAMQAMLWSGVRQLPVIEEDVVVGMLSERDILAQRALAGRRRADQLEVRGAMSAPPVVVAPDADTAEAAAKMLTNRIDSLPVVSQSGGLLGIISTTDIVRHEASRALRGPRPNGLTAADVMISRPLSVRPHETLLDAVALMLTRNIRHLPVTDASGQLVGMLSDREVRGVVGDPAAAMRNGEQEERIQGLDVAAAMSLDPVVAEETEPLTKLVEKFLDERVGAIAVVDPSQQLVGIVSYLDVLRVLRPH
jgi:CBS domain-containing protein